MKAAVLYGQNDIRYEDVPDPVITDNEVLVKVMSTGICGSDIPRVLGTAAHYYPVILGHEFAGEIVETGAKCSRLKKGDRVAGVPLIPCRTCVDCQKGNYSQCQKYSFIGSRRQGAFSEYIALGEDNAVRFDRSVSFDQGIFFEPSTVALHGIMCTNYLGGGSVAVLGGGTIGIFCAQWAKIYGAGSVTVFDIDENRLSLAEEFGVDQTVNTGNESFIQESLGLIRKGGFDYVFETAGLDVTMRTAFEIAGNKSQVCFIGTSPRDISFPHKTFELMNRKEFSLTGSWMSYSAPFPGREWELTSEFFSTGRLLFNEKLIFARYDLSGAAEAFSLFSEPGTVKGKVVITSNS